MHQNDIMSHLYLSRICLGVSVTAQKSKKRKEKNQLIKLFTSINPKKLAKNTNRETSESIPSRFALGLMKLTYEFMNIFINVSGILLTSIGMNLYAKFIIRVDMYRRFVKFLFYLRLCSRIIIGNREFDRASQVYFCQLYTKLVNLI